MQWYLVMLFGIGMTYVVKHNSKTAMLTPYIYKFETNTRGAKIFLIQIQTLFFHDLLFIFLQKKILFISWGNLYVHYLSFQIINVVKSKFVTDGQSSFNLLLTNWTFTLDFIIYLFNSSRAWLLWKRVSRKFPPVNSPHQTVRLGVGQHF